MNKKIARTIAIKLDLIIDLSLKIAGIYLFFIKRQYLNGAIILGMSGIYSLSMLGGLIIQAINQFLDEGK